jgi:hypothetical protein
MSWSDSAKQCYIRHLLAIIFQYDPCKIALRGSSCEYIGYDCQMHKTIKKLYEKHGPPNKLPEYPGWTTKVINKIDVKFTPGQSKILNFLNSVKHPVSASTIASNTDIHLTCISSQISKINQVKHLIKIQKIKGKSMYSLAKKGYGGTQMYTDIILRVKLNAVSDFAADNKTNQYVKELENILRIGSCKIEDIIPTYQYSNKKDN